jgi:hypothetical protein
MITLNIENQDFYISVTDPNIEELCKKFQSGGKSVVKYVILLQIKGIK